MRGSLEWLTVAVFLAALPLAGCLPDERSGTVRAWAWAYDDARRTYSMKVEEIPRLDSLRELRGRHVDFRRSSRLLLELDADGVANKVDRGRPFALEYSLDRDGVVVAADLDSFHALSLYRYIDQIATRLEPLGYVPARPFDVLFLPRYDNAVLGDQRLSLTDNAAYSWNGRAFLIVPSFVLSELPMLLNLGIIAHEFGHAVIHETMFGDVDTVPFETATEGDELVAYRHLRCMHEGVADLIGLGITGDPNFFLATADVQRSLAEPRDMTQEDFTAIEREADGTLESLLPVDVHFHGSTMARAVFEAWPGKVDGQLDVAGRERLLRVVLRALDELEYKRETFTLAAFPNQLVKELEPDERAAACAVFRQRLLPLASRLTRCQATP